MIKASPSALYPKNVGLNNCDREPIHFIGKIQDHGYLVAFDSNTNLISRVSNNINDLIKANADDILGVTIYGILNHKSVDELLEQLKTKNVAYKEETLFDRKFTSIAHKSGNEIVLELEINDTVIDPFAYQLKLSEIASQINENDDIIEKCNRATKLLKAFLGYDRVMIYRFDENWNGQVIAESKSEDMESWLGLHYPASDIPQPARKLFLKQGVRMISDVNANPIEIASAKPFMGNYQLDLTKSELRAVSPIHIEYLKNMKVGASLTAAIVCNGVLWGLVACHHKTAKRVDFYQRLSCQFLTQIFSTSLQLNAKDKVLTQMKKTAFIRSQLLDQINIEKDISKGLSKYNHSLNDLTDSSGAAIYIDGEITLVGECPSKDETIALIKVIKSITQEERFQTNHLMSHFYEAENYKNKASGMLCYFIDKHKDDALCWFKPEVIETVSWAGDPNKPLDDENQRRIHPRKSFEKWSVEQTGKSLPWEDSEIAECTSLHQSIQTVILENYETLKALNAKLKTAYEELESLSYSVSHDLRAPLRGIDGFAHIIKEEYYDSLDEFGKASIKTIIASAERMNSLIDDILEFSAVGKKPQKLRIFSIKEAVENLLPDLRLMYDNVTVELQENLPTIQGDNSINLLLQNLLENAMKYSSTVEKPVVKVGHLRDATFFVKDNGIGFDIKHKDEIFGLFSRLVNDDYDGSGLGLAIAKRVVEKHHGKIWVDSKVNEGSTFYFKLGDAEVNHSTERINVN